MKLNVLFITLNFFILLFTYFFYELFDPIMFLVIAAALLFLPILLGKFFSYTWQSNPKHWFTFFHGVATILACLLIWLVSMAIDYRTDLSKMDYYTPGSNPEAEQKIKTFIQKNTLFPASYQPVEFSGIDTIFNENELELDKPILGFYSTHSCFLNDTSDDKRILLLRIDFDEYLKIERVSVFREHEYTLWNESEFNEN